MASIVMQDPEKAARIIQDAGGQVRGRTRLQKIAYLLEVTDLGEGFTFEYRHYGPYSEQLADAISTAALRGLLSEEERSTSWGGSYSIFTATPNQGFDVSEVRKALIGVAGSADPVALELAATAVFLAIKGEENPWGETARRKPEKVAKLDAAKNLYIEMKGIPTPSPLPQIDVNGER